MAPSRRLIRSLNSFIPSSSKTHPFAKPQFLTTICKRCQSNLPEDSKPDLTNSSKKNDEPVRLLSEVVARKGRLVPKEPEPKKKNQGKFGGVAYPKTRLFVGVVFLGILAWDMVKTLLKKVDTATDLTHSAQTPLTLNIPKNISKHLQSPKKMH